ncbi:MAG TPA: tetratricopeptide repeat protein [Terriglobales bacterium]|jgi:tetratricopeptide (TPR) repeat protein|nr:tetratricopeptide repeat protein [Terriglobales bacterium]
MVPNRRTTLSLIALLLFLGTLLLYYPALRSGFVNYDDPDYVTSNFHVQQGLTKHSVAWAFTSTAVANWHPLTWLSHMLDVQLFGLKPAGHHAQSVFWHALNVVLLFLLLAKATGFIGRSAIVAALFAVHPLNVESVAWVAERKNVLCTFFLLLALATYGWYVKRPRASRYLLVALLFALALMAKPMAITLPFLLLLIDFWPLQRFPQTPLSALVLEKIPLLALSAASAAITVYLQRAGGALGSTEFLPLAMRVKNAIYSYFIYLDKAVWPSRLAVFYPHPEASLALWKVLAAAVILIAITAICWHYRERRYLPVGWLWFLVTLAPVIGIVQVGRQAWADRYAYFPLWGLFVIFIWLLSEAAQGIPLGRAAQAAIALAVLAGYAVTAHSQITYWHDSYSLFAHALQVTGPNPIAEGNLGSALIELRRPDLAAPHLERAIHLMPPFAAAHYNLGTLFHRQNDLARAQQEYQLALKYAPDEREAAQTHNNLGVLFNQLGRRDDAQAEFTKAITLNPYEQNSRIGRGLIEHEEGKLDAALQDFEQAAQISPSPVAAYWEGRVLEEKGQLAASAEAYRNALKLAPNFGDARARLESVEKAMK